MDQNNNILHFNAKNIDSLSDKDKLVYAYHAFEKNDNEQAFKLLNAISQSYYLTQFYKDLSRALLCHSVAKLTNDPDQGKESEFYLIVYRLTKRIVATNIIFKGSGYFHILKEELFKGFNL